MTTCAVLIQQARLTACDCNRTADLHVMSGQMLQQIRVELTVRESGALRNHTNVNLRREHFKRAHAATYAYQNKY